MSITVALRHSTKYIYERNIELSPQVVRLRPAPHTRTSIKGYSLTIKPDDHFINWQQDPFGNYLARLVFPNKVKEFSVDVEVIADLVVINPFDFFVEESAKVYPFEYDEDTRKDLTPYLEKGPQGKHLSAWLASFTDNIQPDISSIDFLVAVNNQLNQDIKYRIRMEPGVQTCEDTLSQASGSCRDSAWLLVQILRHLGLAARFVSGYLVQLKSDEKVLDGPSGPEEDFTDLHAWTEVFLPGAGWIGLDATSGLFASEGHIPLACTPSPKSAAPISGNAESCETTFLFENKVTRIVEKPRVTKPYTEDQWNDIVHLGHQIEQDLQSNDVRLTMGGEPTFVATDNQDAPEWNTAADGEQKRKLAGDLFFRLKDAYAPGALMQYGQGKWYPGEPLPRWKLACYWRKDGQPIWENPELFAGFTEKSQLDKQTAHRLIGQIVKGLQLNPSNLMPAYEDPFYFIWEEQKLPSDVDPLKLDMDGKLERQKLTEVLNHGVENPVAYSIPVRWNSKRDMWESCRWILKRKHLFLTPGNSPAGLRLPLDSIESSEDEDLLLDQKDPFAESRDLPGLDELGNNSQLTYYDSEEVFKSSLVVEVREGKAFVFMPPTVLLEHYLHIIHVIEKVAAQLQLPLIVEGYDPPDDDRLRKFMVTPDPGVIEVNIQPSSTWQELLDIYQELFKSSKIAGLTSEKFNLDGKHTGTGGGNHVTLGGKKPADSPLLRRPDLLQSLVTYWQHHPSLSYLFSTQFIGPTSQAPRVDEGRDEMLYELELAFQQVPDPKEGRSIPFWLVDRLFRNLLIDVTGNTHRAEFCIDKLYSPDTSSGRLGILEFRGFDMPPHERMCLVQLLLIRALVAKFWLKPYRKKLVRWGTALHDRFLLPHYCRQDLGEVIQDLQESGYALDLAWFDPFFSFRFPFVGELQADDIHIEIKMAIEPWHVLGEEISSTGTARFVDSSLERIQVKVSGMTDGRYYLLCNGCKIPLQKTATHGTFVAGIRYRAWQPPSALHPNLSVDTPLVFDLYDTWSNKSVAACKYHVSHPGGRSYDTFPINSFEAEARRTSRFFDFGHSINLTETVKTQPQVIGRLVTEVKQPARTGPIAEIENPEYPFTMDLRQYKSI